MSLSLSVPNRSILIEDDSLAGETLPLPQGEFPKWSDRNFTYTILPRTHFSGPLDLTGRTEYSLRISIEGVEGARMQEAGLTIGGFRTETQLAKFFDRCRNWSQFPTAELEYVSAKEFDFLLKTAEEFKLIVQPTPALGASYEDIVTNYSQYLLDILLPAAIAGVYPRPTMDIFEMGIFSKSEDIFYPYAKFSEEEGKKSNAPLVVICSMPLLKQPVEFSTVLEALEEYDPKLFDRETGLLTPALREAFLFDSRVIQSHSRDRNEVKAEKRFFFVMPDAVLIVSNEEHDTEIGKQIIFDRMFGKGKKIPLSTGEFFLSYLQENSRQTGLMFGSLRQRINVYRKEVNYHRTIDDTSRVERSVLDDSLVYLKSRVQMDMEGLEALMEYEHLPLLFSSTNQGANSRLIKGLQRSLTKKDGEIQKMIDELSQQGAQGDSGEQGRHTKLATRIAILAVAVTAAETYMKFFPSSSSKIRLVYTVAVGGAFLLSKAMGWWDGKRK